MPEVRRVLLVDEDREVLEVTREFLEQVDPELAVEPVASPIEALEQVEQGTVDVVITDYRMAEMDGVELARRVGDDVSCLLYTAATTDGFVDALDGPIDGVVRKRTGTDQYVELAEPVHEVI